jgi:small subunit ribosomal protein S2
MEIPVMAIVDTNSTPDNIDYLVPGNDDALKAVEFYCDIVARTVISGIEEELSKDTKNPEEQKIEDPQITAELAEALPQESA